MGRVRRIAHLGRESVEVGFGLELEREVQRDAAVGGTVSFSPARAPSGTATRELAAPAF